jgi:hypothetical protein
MRNRLGNMSTQPDNLNIRLFTDSKQLLVTIQNPSPKRFSVFMLQQKIIELCDSSASVSFFWCPARSNVALHDEADRLSKNCFGHVEQRISVPKSTTKTDLHALTKQVIILAQGDIPNKAGSCAATFFPNFSHFASVFKLIKSSIDYRLSTLMSGHNSLSYYLSIINCAPSAACACGFYWEDAEHFILYCPLYDSLRSAVCSLFMTPWPTHLSTFTTALKYLKMLRKFLDLSKRLDNA